MFHFVCIRKCYATGRAGLSGWHVGALKRAKPYVLAGWRKRQASPRGLCTVHPTMQQWVASVADDRRAPLDAWESCPEAMGPGSAAKSGQYAAGLLLSDDTAPCPVQPGDVSGGTDARHGVRAPSPL